MSRGRLAQEVLASLVALPCFCGIAASTSASSASTVSTARQASVPCSSGAVVGWKEAASCEKSLRPAGHGGRLLAGQAAAHCRCEKQRWSGCIQATCLA